MAYFHHVEVFRDIPAAAGINGVSMQAHRLIDDTTINDPVVSATVDGEAGRAEFYLADPATTGKSAYELHPGPYYIEGTFSTVDRERSSSGTGRLGNFDATTQVLYNSVLGSGVHPSPQYGWNTMAVTAAGTGMHVDVDSGVVAAGGFMIVNDRSRRLTVPAAPATPGESQFHVVVVEVVMPGEAEQGKATLKIVSGEASGFPSAPTLQQDAELWQVPLADIVVANGHTAISTGDLSDLREFLERSTSAVEDDLVLLESRVNALENPAGHRVHTLNYELISFNLPSIPAHGMDTFDITLASGEWREESAGSPIFIDIAYMNILGMTDFWRMIVRPTVEQSELADLRYLTLHVTNTTPAAGNPGSVAAWVHVYEVVPN